MHTLHTRFVKKVGMDTHFAYTFFGEYTLSKRIQDSIVSFSPQKLNSAGRPGGGVGCRLFARSL
jgi:hypothetical protein